MGASGLIFLSDIGKDLKAKGQRLRNNRKSSLGYGNKHLVIGCVPLNKHFPLEQIPSERRPGFTVSAQHKSFFFTGYSYFPQLPLRFSKTAEKVKCCE